MSRFAVIALAALLFGCATTSPNTQLMKGAYFGVPHSTVVEAEQVRANAATAALAEVVPLPTPLVNRTLVVSIPSLDALKAYRDVVDPPAWNKPAQYARDYMDRTVRAQIVLFSDALRKRGLYQRVEVVDGGSLTVLPKPTAERDALYNVFGVNAFSTQLFFASEKAGAVLVTVDAAAPTLGKQVQGVLDQVTALALSK